MSDTVVGKIEQLTTRPAVGASELKALLADITSCRNECMRAKEELMPMADPDGSARIAYGVVADHLAAIIKRHGG